MSSNFYNVFPKKKLLIGMVHLAGDNQKEKITRALEKIKIYEKEGLDAAIVEDYHGTVYDVYSTLEDLAGKNYEIIIGVNVLSAPYVSFALASKYNLKFVQFDTIQASPGEPSNTKRFNDELYSGLREKNKNVCVLGGVRFKYIPPTGKSLEEDIKNGMYKADAIVTTGEGTGIETPTDKLKSFRETMGGFPLIVGAGVNEKNIIEQMEFVDGAIIGSYFKNQITWGKVIPSKVRKLVNLLK